MHFWQRKIEIIDADKEFKDGYNFNFQDLIYQFDKMVSSPRKIPIAILIFKVEGRIIYKAFSPSVFEYQSTDERDTKTDEFITRIYNYIEYNSRQSNNTRFGKLLEIHKRYINIPIPWRGDIAYFSTEDNIHCDYKVIHRDSPIHFVEEEANNYQQGAGAAQIAHEAAAHMRL